MALLGDDHTAKSSTLAHQSEYAMLDAQIPILNPSNVQELLDYGLIGIALSRYAGVWVSMKCVTATMDSSASVNIDLDRIKINTPEYALPEEGVHIRWPDDVLGQENRLNKIKIPAVKAFVKANKINQSIWSKGKKNIGIVATGKGYAEVRQALSDLGIDEEYASQIGLHLFKVGMPWPLEESSIIDFCENMNEVLVFEEKRPLVEDQIKEILFNKDNRPKKIIGKRDESGKELISSIGELTPDFVSEIIAERVTLNYKDENLLKKLRIIKQNEPDTAAVQGIANRTPYFCSGCPHNSSTKVPEGSKAMAGIGCHFMAAWMDRDTDLFTHMGGEGANWIGMSSFVEDSHIFQNIGDGTYTHSGILASIPECVYVPSPIFWNI